MTTAIKVAVIGGTAVVVAAVIGPSQFIAIRPGAPDRTVSGIVSDCRGPLKDAVAVVRRAQGIRSPAVATDGKGDFAGDGSAADATGLVLEIESGYQSGSFGPFVSDRQSFELKQLPLTFGVSDGTALDRHLSYVAARLNVTAPLLDDVRAARTAPLSA